MTKAAQYMGEPLMLFTKEQKSNIAEWYQSRKFKG